MVKRARIASGSKPLSRHFPEHTEKPQSSPHTSESAAILPSTFKIVVGTYEKLLYGLEGRVLDEPESDEKFSVTLTPIFIFPAHVACVRAVAASPQGGKWLATGSTDEIVKVWDLRRRKEVGGLVQHQGSITRLSFPSRSHLLSASEDGTLALFSTRDWALLRTLKGHKGRVNDVSMHPSGKLALSVGKDRTLRMWDMMRGKGSASTKLGKEGELVRWSVSGKIFVVQAGSTLEIFQTDMTLLDTITHPSRVHDLKFWASGDDSAQEFLLVAAEDSSVTVYQIGCQKRSSKIIAKFTGHTNRVKAIDTLEVASPGTQHQKMTLMSTASSDGNIFVYHLSRILPDSSSADSVPQFKPIASYDTKGSRLVCLTMADGGPAKTVGTTLGKRHSPFDVSMSEPSPSRPQPTNAAPPRKGGRDRRNEPVEVRNSKTLSYILRHGAAKEHLTIRSDGYVRVLDLLARPKLKDLDLPGLLKIVTNDQKQRYQLGVQNGPDGPKVPIVPITSAQAPDLATSLWIRANQGHTLKVDDLETKPITDPSEVPCAVHGTNLKAWESIKAQGLSRMRRNHIHLASGRPGASGVISGMRSSSQILIFIDIAAAIAAGILFHLSANGVILTAGDSNGLIPPVYFSSVEKKVDSGWEEIPVVREDVTPPQRESPYKYIKVYFN
ncbi:hypothetical protein OPQ81_007594 [Rhizoctonia solani]|nr:hypothetical protein OPQ81_007594 [Rhizoctonia solani]